MSQLPRELSGQIYAMFSGLVNVHGFFNNENPRVYAEKEILADIISETCILLSKNGPKLHHKNITGGFFVLRSLVYHTFFLQEQGLIK